MNYLKGTGGSGVTLLGKRYNKQFANHLQDDKHEKSFFTPQDKVLYLYNHPLNVVSSFERRGFLYPAIEKTQGRVELRDEINVPLTNSEGFGDMNLHHFFSHNVDLLDLENHYNYFANLDCEVMLIKYEAINDCFKLIEDWMGIVCIHEEKLLPQTSTYLSWLPHFQDKAREIYGEWIEKYNKLPSFQWITPA